MVLGGVGRGELGEGGGYGRLDSALVIGRGSYRGPEVFLKVVRTVRRLPPWGLPVVVEEGVVDRLRA